MIKARGLSRTFTTRRGTTVFLTTHYLDEADALCDRILVIDGGSVVAEGSPDELKSHVAGDLVSLRTSDTTTTSTVARALPGATSVQHDDDLVTLRIPRGDSVLPTLLRELDSRGVTVSSVQAHRPSLDDVFLRTLRPTLRAPVVIISGITMPLLFLVFFGPLPGSMTTAGGENPWQWFVPGIMVQMALFGTAYAGFGLIPEIRSGALERMRVTPVSRAALLLGRVAKDVLQLLVQSVLLVLVALLFGFRAAIGPVLLGLALVGLLGIAIGSASYALALKLKQEYAFAPVLSSTVMPLMLLSGVLLPMSLAPTWLYAVSRANPLTHVVNGERALVAADFGATAAWLGPAVAVALVVASAAWGVRTFRTRGP